jgi:hypothetical protein
MRKYNVEDENRSNSRWILQRGGKKGNGMQSFGPSKGLVRREEIASVREEEDSAVLGGGGGGGRAGNIGRE